MYVGITYETAPVAERAYYALSQKQKQDLTQLLNRKLAIKAITMLTTCNRTEIYFESCLISPNAVRDILIDFVKDLHQVVLSKDRFLIFNHSIDTVNHLLHVANGLRSAVIGDKQIITQVKEAYQQALAKKNQGSLLERAFQAVFRSHKRIATESLYQRGSTSTAYSSLKMIATYFGKKEIQKRTLLIVGAGEIAEDVLKYARKFNFWEIFIANRTFEKAQKLASRYHIQTYDWKYIEAGDFTSFDAVITAVSNRKNLVKGIENCGKKRLWIDLAMPSNVDMDISDCYNKVYNIDEVTAQVNAINETQLKAIPVVEKILKEELDVFMEWLKKDSIRTFLRSYKNHAKQTFLQNAPATWIQTLDTHELEAHAEKFANRLARKSAKALNHLTGNELKSQQLQNINNTFDS